MALCPTCQTNRGPWDETCVKCGFSYKELDAQKQAAGAKAAAVASGCPACGAPRKEGEESCLGCGVVYAKWKPREAKPAASSSSAASSSAPMLGTDSHKERPGCLTIMMVGTILVNSAAALILPLIHIPGVETGPMIVGSVATAFCAIFVLRWNLWAVYGLYLLQIGSIVYLFFTAPLPMLIQPCLVLALFHHFVSPVRHYFD